MRFIPLLLLAKLLTATATADSDRFSAVVSGAADMERLHTLVVLEHGETVVELHRAGPGPAQPANIKSLSKTVLSMIAGVAIDRGIVDSTDQPLVDLLGTRVPEAADPAVAAITFGHALSMQTGLQSTSGRHYGRWVQSEDWVAHALTRPWTDEPGGRMIYSTGATHLASAALAEASGRSTRALARDWLGEPLEISIPEWMRDPQGIHFGGNEMRLSPRALARLGELYRRGGSFNGEQVISSDWIERSWTARGRSPWTGDDYGYGWFITELAGQRVYYGRGFGGQGLFVVPASGLTIVMTADPTPPSPGGRYFRLMTERVSEIIRVVD